MVTGFQLGFLPSRQTAVYALTPLTWPCMFESVRTFQWLGTSSPVDSRPSSLSRRFKCCKLTCFFAL
jgi:hypothetical protein